MNRFAILLSIASLFVAGSATAAVQEPVAPVTGVTLPTERWESLDNIVFKHWATADGLPHNVVNSIAQDGDGFLWFGTQGGVARWDGYHFRVYLHDSDNPNSLPNNYAYALHTDTTGRLWIGTFGGGLAQYDREHDDFLRVPLDPNDLSRQYVMSIADDGKGGLWVGTRGGLSHVTAGGHTVINLHRGQRNLPDDFINAVLRDRNGKLWIGTQKGLAVEDAGSGDFMLVSLPTRNGATPKVRRLSQSSDGKVWVGTTGDGVFYIDPRDGIAHPLRETHDATSLDDETIFSIHEARPGEVWIGTFRHGVVVVETSSLQTHFIRHERGLSTSLGNDLASAILRDNSGLVWIGTPAGIDSTDPLQLAIHTLFGGVGGSNRIADSEVMFVSSMADGSIWLILGQAVNIVDAAATHISTLWSDAAHSDAALQKIFINAVSGTLNGAVYVAAKEGLFRRDLSDGSARRLNFPDNRESFTLLQDGTKLWVARSDALWLINTDDAQREILVPLPGTEVIAKSRPRVMLRDPDGILWVGSTYEGLYRYDPITHSVTHLQANPSDSAGLSDNRVSCMLLDRHGRLWIGTTSGIDLLVTPGRKGALRFQRLTKAKGLPNDTVGKLIEDDEGKIWASTDAGIAMIDPDTLSVRVLQQAEGVAISAYYSNSGGKTDHGELLFGGNGGLTVIRPDLYKEWRYLPPVVVTDVKLGGKPVSAARFNGAIDAEAAPLAISSDANSIEVEFSALDYSAPAHNLYGYRLDGYDKDWIATDATRRLAAYTNLPPGDYKLRLRGSNRNGLWSERELTLPLRVLPAWYQTWWMRVIDVLAAMAVVAAVVQWRTLYLRQQRRELETEVRLRTEELQETNQELAHLNRLQTEQQSELTRFLAVASHDLRQPMHALNLYLGALSNMEMSERARPVLGNLRQCARIMDDMFLALLDLSRLDAQVVKPKVGCFPIASLLASIEVEFAPQARAKGLTWRTAACSAWVRSDESIIRQILGNLSANAVRYTESGAILVGCRRTGTQLRVCVFDTGIGIPLDQQKFIFEEFCQLGNAEHDRTKGLGLGLAIVRRLARLLNASITLVSTPRKGSMFAIDLPLADMQQELRFATETDESRDTATGQLAGKAVVVVDDEESILDAMHLLLEQWGCIVIAATSGATAIAALAESGQTPHIIISDDRLSAHETGMDAIEALRENFGYSIPALIITGTLTANRLQEISQTGMPVLHKPVVAEDLYEMLVRFAG